VITVFRPNGEACTLPAESDSADAEILDRAVWVDLTEPTREDEALIEQALKIDVPTRDELKDIEPSSRLYVDEQRDLHDRFADGEGRKRPAAPDRRRLHLDRGQAFHSALCRAALVHPVQERDAPYS
jgi:hypothetical protein